MKVEPEPIKVLKEPRTGTVESEPEPRTGTGTGTVGLEPEPITFLRGTENRNRYRRIGTEPVKIIKGAENPN